jgi:drug/metabolite transporter (DMT)-like permease
MPRIPASIVALVVSTLAVFTVAVGTFLLRDRREGVGR